MTVAIFAFMDKQQAAAQSYSNAVMALNPVGYWPLNETVQPPSGQYVATNYGTLGSVGNGYYQSYYLPVTVGGLRTFAATNNIQHMAGATGDGDSALLCGQARGAGQYVVIPRFTNGVANQAVTITAPFTIEAWAMTTNLTSGVRAIVEEGRNQVQGDASHSYTNNTYGVHLGQYHDYFTFVVCNGTTLDGKGSGGKEIDVHNIAVNVWYHLVATYDGSTLTIYTNGVEVTSASFSGYAPDPVSPLLIGTGSDVSASAGCIEWGGGIDDVAIYNTALSQSQIQAHYAAKGAGYASAVEADSPTIYLRLDEPGFSAYPDPGTYPVATNYGSIGAVGNGVYLPGTAPGAAGPGYAGFGASSAVAFNGFYGAVDIGGGQIPAELNPTGNQPQTITAWFQANPADARVQDIASHGDNSWRMVLNGYNGSPSTAFYDLHYNPGANGSDVQFANLNDVIDNNFNVNDGNWHFAAGVSDGTNAYLYIDGRLAKQVNGVTSLAGSSLDAMIGGTPSHTTPSYNTPGTIGYFYGQIAQVAYFTNALDASEIQQMYDAAGVPLTIISQPQSVTNIAATTASISVGVSGSDPVYQWYSTNVNTSAVSPVAGQTNASLTFDPVNLSDAGYYFVVVTNAYSSVTSLVAQLTVVGPPIVLEQSPTDIQVFAGTDPTLQVTVFGAEPLSYQWYSNSIPISGAVASGYTPDTSVVGSSVYSCIVTNAYGSVTNDSVTVAVLSDPTAPYPQQVLADGPVAYYRLDEADGTTAYDYAGGNNAIYTNVALGLPGYSSLNTVNSDPMETAAGFGFFNPPNNYAGNVPSYVNFGTPNGGNAEFSVEAWVTQYAYANGGDAIVALGYGNGGEQFVLDTGNTSSGNLRFFVRNAAGSSLHANSSVNIINDGLWHHVVGVCDEAAGSLYLYMDGKLVGSGTIPAGSGLLPSTTPLSIGARQSSDSGGTNYDFQFYGSIDDVAIYNYALSPAQVQAHYFGSGVAPAITQLTPSDEVSANQGGSVSFTVSATGTTPFTYQWRDNNNNPIPGGTNATLSLSDLQASQSGTYQVTVSNPYGSDSTNVDLSVGSGPPVIVVDLQPTNLTAYAGTTNTFSVAVSGSAPFSYQWYQDGVQIAGATNHTYKFAVLLGSHTYYCSVTNSFSAGTPTVSSTATVTGLPVPTLDPANYTDHIKISFSGYNRGETLKDFPVLVRLSTNLPGFNYSHFADPSGADLRFTDSSGTREIPYEVNQWNPDGESTFWVQVPTLSGTNDSIWAYWGNPGDATLPDYTTNGAVWLPPAFESLPSYDFVYHLEQTGFPYFDSTLQHPSTDGRAPGSTNGIIGLGGLFTRSPYLDAGPIDLGSTFTVSAWINTALVSDEQGICANGGGGYSTAGFKLFVNSYKTSDGTLNLLTGNGSAGAQLSTGDDAVSLGQWHLVTAAVDHDGGQAWLYVDGALQASGAIRNDFPTTNDVNVAQSIGNGYSFLGLMDEARIRSGLESSNWVWASYMTVAQNSTLQSYSTVTSTVTNPPTPVTINVQFSDGNLTISGAGGSAGGTYYVIGSTNLALPMSSWPVLSTNTFDGSGNFNVSMPVDATKPAQFISIKQ